jgi:hypothetical protein
VVVVGVVVGVGVEALKRGGGGGGPTGFGGSRVLMRRGNEGGGPSRRSRRRRGVATPDAGGQVVPAVARLPSRRLPPEQAVRRRGTAEIWFDEEPVCLRASAHTHTHTAHCQVSMRTQTAKARQSREGRDA